MITEKLTCQKCKHWSRTSKTSGVCTIHFGSKVEIAIDSEVYEETDLISAIDHIFTDESFFCAALEVEQNGL